MTGAIVLRPARSDDAAWAHALRNMPHIREASLNPSPITLDKHVVWWQAALSHPDRALYVIVHDDQDVGVLRLDRHEDAAEVSIYTKPGLQGRGVGRQAILNAVPLAHDRFGVRRLVATIRDENIASQRAFTAAGFSRHDDGWSRDITPAQTSGA